MIKMTNFTVIDIYLQVIDYCVQMYKKEGKAIDLRIENNALKSKGFSAKRSIHFGSFNSIKLSFYSIY